MISIHPRKPDDKSPWGYSRRWLIEKSTDIHVIAKKICEHVWSPIWWEGGVRKSENFKRADYLVFDFETHEMSVEDAVNRFSDMKHIIGLTRNHQVDKGDGLRAVDRFRVLIKFMGPIKDRWSYEHTLKYSMKHYPCDQKCGDAARLFFPCKEIVSINDDGFDADIQELENPLNYYEREVKELREKRKEYSLRQKEEREISAFARNYLNNIIPLHERNETCHRMAKDLIRIGLSEEQTFELIKSSPTYGGRLSEGLEHEIKRAITSAGRAVANERV